MVNGEKNFFYADIQMIYDTVNLSRSDWLPTPRMKEYWNYKEYTNTSILGVFFIKSDT